MSLSSIDIRQWDFNGKGEILLVDKPLDWTSFDVVNRIRKEHQIKKIGHAGTLDPKATGLLILCTGPQTKTIDRFVGLEKEYKGKMELGVRTESFDSEGETIETRSYSDISIDLILSTTGQFIGKQQQLPPMYSAVKVKGKPLYKYARKGKTIERVPKGIEIREFEITNVLLPMVDFRVVCSKGTYIRALVEDFGLALGCGATLRALRRTRIGTHHVKDASTVSSFLVTQG